MFCLCKRAAGESVWASFYVMVKRPSPWMHAGRLWLPSTHRIPSLSISWHPAAVDFLADLEQGRSDSGRTAITTRIFNVIRNSCELGRIDRMERQWIVIFKTWRSFWGLENPSTQSHHNTSIIVICCVDTEVYLIVQGFRFLQCEEERPEWLRPVECGISKRLWIFFRLRNWCRC